MFRALLCHLISLVVVLGFVTSSAEGTDPNLAGWWRFDEGAGDTTADSSGNGHDGILVGGATWAAGRFGYGIDLDGTSGYVSIPDFELTTDTITFVAWFNGWKGGNWAPFISYRDLFVACEMKFGDNDTLHYVWNDDSSATWRWDGGPVIPQDTWTMLAVTIDPDRATAYVYTDIDGLSQGTNEIAHFEQTLGALQIGYSYSMRYLDGVIDEAAIFSRTLTEEEIMALVSGIGGGYPFVVDPHPADGEIIDKTWVELKWRAGDLAVSHDVYLSDNFDDVNDGAVGAFQGNQIEMSYFAGIPGYGFPEGLEPGTTYYWRIDEVNDADPNSPWKGPVWNFRIPSRQAYDPFPADGSMFMPLNVTLEWTGGFGSKLHTLYFGETFEDVNNATGGPAQQVPGYSLGPLEYNKTYYWRVDEMDPPKTHRGEVWSFTTAGEGLGSAVMDRWENLDGYDLETLKADPEYPDNPDVTETVTEFAWNGPDQSWYGARIEAWLYVRQTGEYTFWLNSDDHGELWLSTNDDPGNGVLIAVESSHTSLNSWGTGEEQSNPVTLVGGRRYYISALWKEGDGYDHCQVAWQGPGIPERTIIAGSYLSPFKPMAAFGARPGDGAVDVTPTPVLHWKPGLQAASHEVYFGTDEDAVSSAAIGSPEHQGAKLVGDETFGPGKLPWLSTFFWRVDEVNDLNPASPWIGKVWTFTTADFLIVDDFEGYTNDDRTDGAIWQHWVDGFGVSANGSQVGYVSPPFAERTIVHNGHQSMPLSYSNGAGVTNSEAKLTLHSGARDWTEGGVGTLSIRFHGRSASVGGLTEEPAGTFTLTGSGADIWGKADEFHFAYKKLTGPGTIIARIDSVEDTADWAKAGLMIRETLEPGSKHALAAVTCGYGVVSEGRIETDGASFSYAEEQIEAPRWVKLQRDQSDNFTVFHSADGQTWSPVRGALSENIKMRKTVYVGLAVTAYDSDLTCEAVFSNITIVGQIGAGGWTSQDIGIASNVSEPMYVAISNAAGPPAVVTHDDPDAALTRAWTEWTVDLSRFADQGIDLSDVDSIAIGFGSKAGVTADGGSGVVFFDDIRLVSPGP